MIEWLAQFNYWHWLALGLILLAVELLGAAGYFLWLGLSALLVGVIMVLIPIGWQLQWLTFASFVLVTTWLWWRRQFKADRSGDAQRGLNQKKKQLLGHKVQLEQPVTALVITRLQIGDSTWSAICDEDIAAGHMVEVVDLDGIILKIKPYQPNQS